ncbi:MAG: hypothetical protein Q8L49_05570 [Burkholderiaceae bacterium]|nr:hypothetical protein [Burkholderiaceae bacterium]
MIDPARRLLLAARRQRLVQRAALQRRQLGAAVAPLAQAWGWVERGIVVGLWLRQRPWLLAAPLGLLLWWRPRGLLRLLASTSALWRLRR